MTYSAMDNHLMVSSQAVGRDVTLFYRDAQLTEPVMMSSPSDLAEVIGPAGGAD